MSRLHTLETKPSCLPPLFFLPSSYALNISWWDDDVDDAYVALTHVGAVGFFRPSLNTQPGNRNLSVL